MKHIYTDTLIIGAGPAGLACAMELSKARKDFIVVEKDSTVGGLAKTYKFVEPDGLVFLTDNGPHRFFSKNQYLYTFIEELIGEDWIRVRRQTRQYIDGVFYEYPVNVIQALKNIGLRRTLRMAWDYMLAKTTYGLLRKPVRTFEDYAVSNFGRSLANFNIINYTEKIWGIPVGEIHTEWALQRIRGLNLGSVLKNAFTGLLNIGRAKKPKSLVDEFFYPSKGTGLIYETIAAKLKESGYIIMTGTTPTVIRHVNGRIHEVILRSPEGVIMITCANLVESIPITEFVPLLDPAVPKQVSDATQSLRHRSQVYLFITLDIDSVTADQWIYFPQTENTIARISEMKNFSPDMSPKGKTSLFVEFFCFEGDVIWNMSADELFEQALAELSSVGFLNRSSVRHFYHIRQRNAYPVYDLEYQTNLGVIKRYLDSFSNMYYIGRPGRFRYNNQDHSLEMGIMAANSIIDRKRYDIESIGNEKEYYEKGSVPGAKN